MDYKDALKKLIQLNGVDILQNKFIVYSCLCDYVGGAIYQIKLVKLFCDIQREHNLVQVFKEKGLLEGRKYLVSLYIMYYKQFSFTEYKDAINPISEIVCPEEYKKYFETKKNITEKGTKNIKCIVKSAEKIENSKYMEKIDYINLEKLVIDIYAKALTIKYDKNKEGFYIDDKPIELNDYSYKSKTLITKINKKGRNVVLYLSEISCLKKLTIKTKNTNIDIPNEVLIDDVTIKTTTGSVNSNLRGTNLNIKTTSGNIFINIYYSNIKCQSYTGLITYTFFDNGLKKNMVIDLKTIKGNISGYIDYNLRKIKRKLKHTFRRITNIEEKIEIRDCLVEIFFSTNYGIIETF